MHSILPEKYKQKVLELHKNISVILRVISCRLKVNIECYNSLCMQVSCTFSEDFKWVQLNDTLHATLHHSKELIVNNNSEGLGPLSEEALESNYKDIRNFMETQSRKFSKVEQLTDVMSRLLERSDPQIKEAIQNQRSSKRCSTCESDYHTVRSHQRIVEKSATSSYDVAVASVLVDSH